MKANPIWGYQEDYLQAQEHLQASVCSIYSVWGNKSSLLELKWCCFVPAVLHQHQGPRVTRAHLVLPPALSSVRLKTGHRFCCSPSQGQIPVLRLHAASSLWWQQGGEGHGEGHHDAQVGRGGVLGQPTPAALHLPRLPGRDVLREIRVLQGEPDIITLRIQIISCLFISYISERCL